MIANQNNTEPRNPDVSTDKSEINLKAIVLFGTLLVLACLVSMSILAGLFTFYAHREARLDQPPSPLVLPGLRRLPPEPRLQLSPGHENPPMKDLAEFQQAEESSLSSYGWVNQAAGVVHIPIERAKNLVLARSLPVRAPAGPVVIQQSYESAQDYPTASSSGRVTRKEF
jgi:hypothetical protein